MRARVRTAAGPSIGGGVIAGSAWSARIGRLAGAAASAVALAVAGLAGCGAAAPVHRYPDLNHYVTADGTRLLVAGRRYRFVGFDLYDAAATPRYHCSSTPRMTDDQLDAAFGYLHDEAGATVVRFWAYQSYTDGGTDWSGVDRVIRLARAHDLRVLPVLEDGPGDCTTDDPGQPKIDYHGDTWYTRGYRTRNAPARLSYRDYVQRIVRHYRDQPDILGWMLMNEAETNARTADGTSALVPFARDMAGLVHRIDAHHLVTLGTQGNGAPGASGPDFAAVYGVPGLDFTEVHDWAYYGSDTEPMPGATAGGALPSPSSAQCRSRSAPIACSFAAARSVLHKPLVVGEAGIRARSAAGRLRRSVLLGAKIRAAFADGASGYLVWHYSNGASDGYDVLSTDHDPLMAVLHREAAALHAG